MSTNLLTAEQVAARVGKNVSTVNRWANSGKLPAAIKLPGRTGANLFDPEEVDALDINRPCPVCSAPIVWGVCRAPHPRDDS